MTKYLTTLKLHDSWNLYKDCNGPTKGRGGHNVRPEVLATDKSLWARCKAANGLKLTTKDFEALGYSLEDYLRYAQVNDETQAQFHKAISPRQQQQRSN